MRIAILFALVAVAAAVPLELRPVDVHISEKIKVGYPTVEHKPYSKYDYLSQHFNQEGNIYQVPQYIAFQFHYFQQHQYTPSQVSDFLLVHEFPQYVVDYLSHQYELGLTQHIFETPYLIFQHYSKQTIPQEVQQYLHKYILEHYDLFQQFLHQYGFPKVFEQKYSGVPVPISDYMNHQLRYIVDNVADSNEMNIASSHLIYSLQHAEHAMQYFVNGTIPKTMHMGIYELLSQGLIHLQQAQRVYQPDLLRQEVHLPYTVYQHYIDHIHQAYLRFQTVYQYVQQHPNIDLPELFVYHLRHAYLTIEMVYKMYQPINSYTIHNEVDQHYKTILNYIHLVREYIQTHKTIPEVNYIYEQLTQAYQLYHLAYESYVAKTYNERHMIQGYQYLNSAYTLAQQIHETYIQEQLHQALQHAQILRSATKPELTAEYQHEWNMEAVVQHSEALLNYVREQIIQGKIPEVHARYIVKQLELIHQHYQYPVETDIYHQVREYYQNILDYIRLHHLEIPQQIQVLLTEQIKYDLEKIEMVWSHDQDVVEHGDKWMPKYWNKNTEDHAEHGSEWVPKYWNKNTEDLVEHGSEWVPKYWNKNTEDLAEHETQWLPKYWNKNTEDLAEHGSEWMPKYWNKNNEKITEHGSEWMPKYWNKNTEDLAEHGSEWMPKYWSKNTEDLAEHGSEWMPKYWNKNTEHGSEWKPKYWNKNTGEITEHGAEWMPKYWNKNTEDLAEHDSEWMPKYWNKNTDYHGDYHQYRPYGVYEQYKTDRLPYSSYGYQHGPYSPSYVPETSQRWSVVPWTRTSYTHMPMPVAAY